MTQYGAALEISPDSTSTRRLLAAGALSLIIGGGVFELCHKMDVSSGIALLAGGAAVAVTDGWTWLRMTGYDTVIFGNGRHTSDCIDDYDITG